MSFASACESWAAVESQRVRDATWGHLYPPAGSVQTGFIEFIAGSYQAVHLQPVSISFGTLPDSEVLYGDVHEFLFQAYANPNTWLGERKLAEGLYRWEGTYRKCKNGVAQFQKGKLRCIYKFP